MADPKHEPGVGHFGVTHIDHDVFEEREGHVIERNGSLYYVEDDDGTAEWLCAFEFRRHT